MSTFNSRGEIKAASASTVYNFKQNESPTSQRCLVLGQPCKLLNISLYIVYLKRTYLQYIITDFTDFQAQDMNFTPAYHHRYAELDEGGDCG